MQPLDWYQTLAGDLAWGLNHRCQAPLSAALEAADLGWDEASVAQIAHAAEPGLVGVAQMAERDPYSSTEALAQRLSGAAEHGVLTPEGEGYRLAPAGQAIVARLKAVLSDGLRALDPAAPPETGAVADLLFRQVQACLAAPIPIPCLQGSRVFDPGPGASAVERLRRYLQDLLFYRDDAHVAAWRVHGLPGYQWEVFSHVWGDKVWGDPIGSPAAAAAKLGFRGYDEAGFRTAMDDLAARGWLAVEDGRYRLTDAGRALRQATEEATDRNYFGPWQLSEAEAGTLRAGLEDLRAAFPPPQEADEDEH